MSEETTGLTIPMDDPRRMLHVGDEAKAYPESALFRVYEREVDAIKKFLAELSRRDLRICREGDDPVKIIYEGDDFEHEDTLWNPMVNSEIERIAMATFDIDENERQRELNIMLLLRNGVNPPDEPTTMTIAQAEELGRNIDDMYKWHPARIRYYDITRNDDGTAYIIVAFQHYTPSDTTPEWVNRRINTPKQLRTLVAQLAQEYADAKQGKGKKAGA